jgi:hypothetical protein
VERCLGCEAVVSGERSYGPSLLLPTLNIARTRV